ncbi:alkane 1-monooxygenase [Aeromicrobium alkaliterrae]|uniref:Fatty acid desaturase n=1 Tax=Aeromicrobium alkaliterrae TaxID=302168 RepID=A0ABN2JWH6_9ACTN
MTVSAVVDGHKVEWTDKKRYLWIMGAVIPLIPMMIWGLVAATEWHVWWYFGPFFVFVLIPLFDLVAGLDPNNPPDELIEALEEDRYYRWVTFAFIPLQIAGFLWGCFLLGDGTIFGWDPFTASVLPGIAENLTWYDKVGLATGMGMVAGIGINTAHELGHKKEELERWFARVALAQTAYGHFYIEHNRGHHVRVATPEDPASSRMGETVWEFMPRTVIGSLRSSWELEKKRFARLKKSPYSLKNDLINAWMFTVLLWGFAMAAFGWQIFPFLVIQAILGIWLLESVNYLEHYGMKRAKLESGRYERVNPSHSWNSNNIGTNVLLYHLQRHSDHHANPTRRYQALRDFKEAPVLPTGYAGMIVATWVPQIWRKVMDERVLGHYDGDITQANVHPRLKEKYYARYGASDAPEQVAV